ncbi:glycosyltransferase [Pelagicoccus mobilis]|uniref:Glycosyltransferase n=1 Tax=Pelagicoccus mobilis TaxID=415221 RepID=A0A934VSY2_9BACT|nr:glycosyltransferase [Pelagicoccus mobilis]MBK1879500.1 glycosyltransferase [Pelagicoccus mobilis]
MKEVDLHVSWNADAIPEDFATNFPFPIHFHHIRPYHFASNNNALAEFAQGDYLLFINDDVVLDDNVLLPCLERLQNQKIGLVSINLRYRNETVQHAGIYFREDGTPYHRYKHAVHYSDPRVKDVEIVPAVTGAFILVRKDEFAKVKFDENFEIAGEDIVFSLEFKRTIKKSILYCGNLTALHAENETRRVTKQRLTPPHDLQRIRNCYFEVKPENQDFRKILKLRVVTEKEGWIMHRKASEITKHIPNSVINEDMLDAHVHYYINYGFFQKRPKNGLVVANFTHYDPDGLGNKFFEVAQEVDHCVSVSNLTTELLVNGGIPPTKITTIPVGADSSFKPKLTLGVVGRVYPGGRKGESLVKELIKDESLLSKLQIVSTNDSWGVEVWNLPTMQDFYRSIDYLLVPATIEGGPVPFMEALACGTLSIAPRIGVVPEFPHIPYETGNLDSLKETLSELVFQHDVRNEPLISKIRNLNWENWANSHIALFMKLITKVNEQ